MALRRVTCLALLCVLIAPFATPHPLGRAAPSDQPADQTGDNFEGDILLSDEQQKEMRKRTGMYLPTFIWPDRTVPYEIVSTDFTTATTADYVRIAGGSSGCSSFVGRIRGAQALRLQPSSVGTGCFTQGTIVHELIHALGFYHMQSATERDLYVDILWQNIVPGREGNFQSYGTDRIINYGVGYDYGSVMHYNTHAFSANGLPTVVPKVANVAIGQRVAMSSGDIQRIRNILSQFSINLKMGVILYGNSVSATSRLICSRRLINTVITLSSMTFAFEPAAPATAPL
uniref:Metalloendopeptidase n=1 Tax=Anopheles coluzzii TaxID=1518534 RepID=A0A8W7P9E3_ANOCL